MTPPIYHLRSPLVVKTNAISDDYSLTRSVLGIGVSGNVRECFSKLDNTKYALKILPDNVKSRREVEIHWRVSSHPNIVAVKSVYENMHSSGRCLLIVMECMQGGELFNRIQQRTKKNPFTEKEAVGIVRCILDVLHFLHFYNIAHRDLKPENLLYTNNETDAVLKLTDFGFAKESSDTRPSLKTPCFTPYYVAPEVLGPEMYDRSCDVWSLGVITYILLCGYPPFFSHQGLAISPGMKKRIRAGDYGFPTAEWKLVSMEAQNLIRSMLTTKPHIRPSVSDLIAHPWFERQRTHAAAERSAELHTAQVLQQERSQWVEVTDELDRSLAIMRVNYDQCKLKQLSVVKNKLLEKRRKRALAVKSI